MNFKEAYKAMQEGKKVRRKIWKAYWHYDKKTERCYSHIDDKYSDREVKEIIFEDSLAEDWEVVEEEKKYWKPKKDEKYYYITDCGLYSNLVVNDDYLYANWLIERARFNMGNCFKTKEEAEHMVEKLKVIHELQKFAYENNEGEIEWGNKCYYLCYDHLVGKIEISENIFFQFLPFNIYFTSRMIALMAIETIGADRIKKYYFDVEE